MEVTLARQIDNIAIQIQREKSVEDILRIVSFGSKLAGNTAVINLAIKFASINKKVVIVDLIAQNQSLRTTVGVQPKYFAEDYLNQETVKLPKQLVLDSKISGISIISTNDQHIKYDQLNHVFDGLSHTYDCVILNEGYSNTQKTNLMRIRIPNFSVLIVDQQQTSKRKLARFLNGSQIKFDACALAN